MVAPEEPRAVDRGVEGAVGVAEVNMGEDRLGAGCGGREDSSAGAGANAE